jgi:hypothetical protein
MYIPTYALTFHFISPVADAKREYIGAGEHGIDLNFTPIHAARPAACALAEVQPIALAVDGDFVGHRKQFSVLSSSAATSPLEASPPRS